MKVSNGNLGYYITLPDRLFGIPADCIHAYNLAQCHAFFNTESYVQASYR